MEKPKSTDADRVPGADEFEKVHHLGAKPQSKSPGSLEADESRPRNKGIYLLPNLLTTGALFCGFYAVVVAMQGRFEAAAIAIFVAMVLDGLDGRVARLTNTQSDFGAQYDSLSDMLAFGVAPALVVLNWSLSDLGKTGWTIAFIYVSCAALRLARFNTQLGSTDKKYFIGLASPAAAAVLAGMVWAFAEVNIDGRRLSYISALIVTSAGLLMVSNLRYHSFKQVDFRGRVPFVAVLAVVMLFVIISIDPARVLWGSFLLYALSGPVFYLLSKYRRKPVSGG